MKTFLRRNHAIFTALPLRVLYRQIRFPFLITLSVLFIIVSHTNPKTFEPTRLRVMQAFSYILMGLAQPVITTQKLAGKFENVLSVYEENQHLRLEVDRLKDWYQTSLQLQDENLRLKTLLNIKVDKTYHHIAARVIATPNGGLSKTIIVDAGQEDGITTGQAVLTQDGLVGRVVELAPKTARILLLTDVNSRIPVILEKSRIQGILGGTNEPRLQLFHFGLDVTPIIKERVLTSGQGGLLPPGLPIGIVADVNANVVTVNSFVDLSRLEFVRIVDYALPGLVKDTHPSLNPPPPS